MAVKPAVDVVARTICGEARGQGILDMLAVGAVIRERVLRPGWWGHDWESVCKAKWQFSCWNEDDPNLPIILSAETKCPDVWPLCLMAADLVVNHMREEDFQNIFDTKGPLPTHYHSHAIRPPKWAEGATRLELPWKSAHIFYTGVAGTPRRRS